MYNRAFKAASTSGSTTDLAEPESLECHASVDSGLNSCETDSPMFGKSKYVHMYVLLYICT